MRRVGHFEIVSIIDRSGSMESIRGDVIGGFNSFLRQQKEIPGTADLTLVFFDTEMTYIHKNLSLDQVPDISENDYLPNGSTALLDAIGLTIQSVGQRLSELKEEERPEKVIVSILTDGEENSSRTFSKSQIQEMIQHQKEVYNWEFIFLGANQDSFAEAGSLGISADSIEDFEFSGKGTVEAFRSISLRYARMRAGK